MPEVNKLLGELLSIPPDAITIIVFAICVALFIFSFPFPRLRDISPTLMISAGIIGTFWGTFIALSEFQTGGIGDSNIVNRKAMVESIPAVLGGMKSAFITSLIGLFAAFISKIFFIIIPRKAPPPLPVEQDMKALLKEIKDGIIGESDKSLSSQLTKLRNENTQGFKTLDGQLDGLVEAIKVSLVDNMKVLMKQIENGVVNQLTEQLKITKELEQAIAGDAESSIAGQLTKLRKDNIQGFKTLDGRLDGLAEAIKVSLVDNMKALMKQIEDVIVNQLTEQLKITNELLHDQLSEMLNRIEDALIKQFGETFKQFNEATQAIKKWQEEHKEHVEQLTAAFQETAQGIGKIRADCESIPATMQELTRLMGELDERLKAFAEMKTQAEQSFPIIKENLDAVGNDLRAAAAGFEGLEDTITKTYQNAQTLAAKHIKTATEHVENMGREINKAIGTVSTSAQEMMGENKKVSVQYSQDIRKIIGEVQDASEKCTSDTREALENMAEKHAQEINGLMEEIMTKWGKNMVGIAEKVAEIIKQGGQR